MINHYYYYYAYICRYFVFLLLLPFSRFGPAGPRPGKRQLQPFHTLLRLSFCYLKLINILVKEFYYLRNLHSMLSLSDPNPTLANSGQGPTVQQTRF